MFRHLKAHERKDTRSLTIMYDFEDPNDRGILSEVIQLWRKLHPTPNQQYVLKMLTDLNQCEIESLPVSKVKCSTLPTAAHVVHDIFADDDIHYRSCRTGKNEGTRETFLAAWVLLER